MEPHVSADLTASSRYHVIRVDVAGNAGRVERRRQIAEVHAGRPAATAPADSTGTRGWFLEANAIDVANGEESGLSPAMMDRLKLDPARIKSMAEGIREIAALPWMEGCGVRLHEEGFHLSGIVLLGNRTLTAAQVEEVRAIAHAIDWRLDQIDVSLDTSA